ncbi:MAG: formylglycine-generating enzyme family protein, partial [Planctomycetota bacterium]|nr:formylglycine-generating enzyme family protein [Planctomycetota bacterium]
GTVDDEEAQAEHDELETLVHALEAFSARDPAGPLESVRERRADALILLNQHIQATSNEHPWEPVQAALSTDLRFRGFELKPQVGLWPLGKDPVSGLQEFSVSASGPRPARDESGVLVHDDVQRAIVLVLVPGGTVRLGAMRPGPGGGPPGGANVDPMAAPSEGPPHDVALEPFFLSKYELTQGQWLAVMGENPSSWAVGRGAAGRTVTKDHPVESIPWAEAQHGLMRLGLVLPTEAQWEHAVRAGTSTAWWSGATQESIKGKLNIADMSAVRNGESWRNKAWKELDDGYVIHAPVGTFPPNPWGFHETLGNVREWCLDRYGTYLAPSRPGDGLRMEFYDPNLVVTRGGSYSSRVIHSRVTSRGRTNADVAETWVGIRPARVVEK